MKFKILLLQVATFFLVLLHLQPLHLYGQTLIDEVTSSQTQPVGTPTSITASNYNNILPDKFSDGLSGLTASSDSPANHNHSMVLEPATVADNRLKFTGIGEVNEKPSIISKSTQKKDFTKASQSLRFTENKGQIRDHTGKLRPDILFAAKANGVKLYLTKEEIIYVWHQNTASSSKESIENQLSSLPSQSTTYQINLELVGINPKVNIYTEQQTEDIENYYSAHAQQGITRVRSYQKIVYREVYPHIDLLLYSNPKGLKYDFVVKPGGKVADIQMRYKGHKSIAILTDGALQITNPLGILTEVKPLTYNLKQQQEKVVNSSFLLRKGIISFKVGAYNEQDTLVIDPAVSWASYYGGAGNDVAAAITTDKQGNVYMSGATSSNSGIAFGGFQGSFSGNTDAFLVKFNAAGERIWATYYGGAGQETGRGITTDDNGNIYLTGLTFSSSGIAFNGFQNQLSGGSDAFLVKFNAAGERQWATYYGGDKDETGSAPAIDTQGNVYLIGETRSTSGIAFNGHQNTLIGAERDAFLVKFNPAGERIWATYYGGENRDFPDNITVDQNNNIYFAGFTSSRTGIAFKGFQNQLSQLSGGSDAFLVKLNASGERQWATYYGGSDGDTYGSGPAVDKEGNIYIVGQTSSSTGIASNGHQNTYGGKEDGFLVKFNSAGERLWATYYGGSERDKTNAVKVNQNGDVYVAGRTASSNGMASNGHQNTYGGGEDGLVVKFNAAGERLWATYYGGSNFDVAYALAIDVNGNAYIAGETSSERNIANSGTQNTLAGGKDAFIVKFENIPTPPVLTSASPADNSKEVQADTKEFTMTFNEPVEKGRGKIIIYQNSTVLDEIDVSSDAVAIEGATVTIGLKKGLTPGSDIYIQMPVGIFTDLDGNGFAGIDNTTTWNFTVAGTTDETPPIVHNFSPADNAVEIAVNSNLEFTFSEPIEKGTGNITINQGTTSQTIDVNSASVSIAGNKVTINPAADFPEGAEINVQFPAGVFKDLADNDFTGINNATTWNFSTRDESPEKKNKVVKLVLVDADRDRDIMEIKEGDVINVMNLPTQHVNIRAYTDPVKVGSVLFDLDGTIAVENSLPYVIGGDARGDYRHWTLPVGEHTLTATPYSKYTPHNATVGNGTKGIPLTVHFTVTGYAVNELVLLNADTDEDIQTLKNGDIIDLGLLATQHLNIRAITNPMRVGRVMFDMDGTVVREYYFPYAIGGDIYGDYRTWTLPLGKHTLTATPYNYMGGGGKSGVSHRVEFTVINSSPSAKMHLSTGSDGISSVEASPNPFSERTTVTFSVIQTGQTTVGVYDMQGKLVGSLFTGNAEAGKKYTVDVEGRNLQSGVFIVKLSNDRSISYYKLVLAK